MPKRVENERNNPYARPPQKSKNKQKTDNDKSHESFDLEDRLDSDELEQSSDDELEQSLNFASNDGHNYYVYKLDSDEQLVIELHYKELDNYLAEFSYELVFNKLQGIRPNQFNLDKNFIHLLYQPGASGASGASAAPPQSGPDPNEFFHLSLFIGNRYGGLHVTCPGTKTRLYVTHEDFLSNCHMFNVSKTILTKLFNTLKRYFETENHKSGNPIKGPLKNFVDCVFDRFRYITTREEAKNQIVERLNTLISNIKGFESFLQNYCSKLKNGGSTKTVMYLVKIDKLKQKNKLLKKDKIKNKNKIEKNNKLINELKAKAKKEKAKAKAKAKKEKAKAKAKAKKEKAKAKAKAKAKKVTCKKSTCSKKNKK